MPATRCFHPRGRRHPHPRHWLAIAELVGLSPTNHYLAGHTDSQLRLFTHSQLGFARRLIDWSAANV